MAPKSKTTTPDWFVTSDAGLEAALFPQDTPLSFESPESGTIIRARYDPETRQMFIDLRKAAVTYRYTAIEPALWEEFVQSESKGRFFTARIRPLYVGIRV